AKHEKNFKPDQEKAKIATYFNEKQSLTNSSTKPFVRLFPSRNCQRWDYIIYYDSALRYCLVFIKNCGY
ncbi:MAG: hypothetical protein IKZ43_01625, partial [Acidaminococcaceae bacterium]|nr:hypothetical protein [Acidaminococcaceae bacterium]